MAAACALEILEPGYHREYLRRGIRAGRTGYLGIAAACGTGPLSAKRNADPAKDLGADVPAGAPSVVRAAEFLLAGGPAAPLRNSCCVATEAMFLSGATAPPAT